MFTVACSSLLALFKGGPEGGESTGTVRQEAHKACEAGSGWEPSSYKCLDMLAIATGCCMYAVRSDIGGPKIHKHS